MDLRHTRTFVTVAELGTVSKAALRLRLTQPALSRQISDLEQELGLRLFDRVGRRLLLTSEGEQLLSECRALLTHAGAVRERAELLRRGDRGVLKVAASPQHIESVFLQFLHLYAERFPNVEVRVSEGTGSEILAMLERGDIHLGQNLLHAVRLDEGRFGQQSLEPVELLAGCRPSLKLGRRGAVEVAELPLTHCCCSKVDSAFDARSTLRPAWRGSRRRSGSRAARRTRCWHWPKRATASQYSRRRCEHIAMRCGSFA
jgi:LysR family transcriptional regulator, nitrogen assimilation regulatory protein